MSEPNTLLDIEAELAALVAMIEQAESGDRDGSTPEFIASVNAQIEHYLTQRMFKVDAIAAVLDRMDLDVEFCRRQAVDAQDRARRKERSADRLRQYVIYAMQRGGERRLEGRTATLSIHDGKGRVEVVDENLVPEQFINTERTVNRNEIMRALQRHESVPGVRLVTGEPYLKVRR